MAKKYEMSWQQRAALDFYLEETAGALLSMLVDHGDGCGVRQAGVDLLALAGWTEERLAEVIVERAFL